MAAAKKTPKTSKSKTSARGRSTGAKSTSGRAASGRSATGSARGRSRASSNATTDHEEIRRWAEARSGKPACVRGTGGRGDIGMLRLEFPGGKDEKLQPISWEDWFEKFDERGLALLVQDKTAGGQQSRFNKLVSRETAEASGKKSGGTKTRKATS